MSDEEQKWLVMDQGNERGPFTYGELVNEYDQMRVFASTLVRKEGDSKWIPYNLVPEDLRPLTPSSKLELLCQGVWIGPLNTNQITKLVKNNVLTGNEIVRDESGELDLLSRRVQVSPVLTLATPRYYVLTVTVWALWGLAVVFALVGLYGIVKSQRPDLIATMFGAAIGCRIYAAIVQWMIDLAHSSHRQTELLKQIAKRLR